MGLRMDLLRGVIRSVIVGRGGLACVLKRLLVNARILDQEISVETAVSGCADLLILDPDREFHLAEYLWQKLRCREFETGMQNPVAICALGFKTRAAFVADPCYGVFEHVELGYCYVQKPIRWREFIESSERLSRPHFDMKAVFQIHIKEFGSPRGIVASLAHDLKYCRTPQDREIHLTRIGFFVPGSMRAEIDDCIANGCPLEAVEETLTQVTRWIQEAK